MIAGPTSSRKRWHALLVALLLAEGLVLGVSVDSASLTRLKGGWWDPIFAVTPRVMPVSASIAAAALLVIGPNLRRRLTAQQECQRQKQRRLIPLHLACFAGLFLLSAVLCSESGAVGHVTGVWVAAWLLLGGLTLLSWLTAFFGPRTLRVIATESGGWLIASIGVGLLAWAAGTYSRGSWVYIRTPTLRAAYGLLRRVDPTAWTQPDRFLIGAGQFAVEISTDCSGYEGVGLLWVFLFTFFWLSRSRLRFPHAFLLLISSRERGKYLMFRLIHDSPPPVCIVEVVMRVNVG